MKENDCRKYIIYYNLGCAYHFLKNKKNAIENLELSIKSMNLLLAEKKDINVLSNSENILKRIKAIKSLLNSIK